MRARQYPWGVVQVKMLLLFLFQLCGFTIFVQVENENHCDFTKLREMLIRTNMEDLCDSTHSRHYELYRKERLKQMGFEEGDKEGKVMLIFEANYFMSSYTGKQFRGDLHNAEGVSFAVAPRKGRGDETKVCPQVIKYNLTQAFLLFVTLHLLGLKRKRPS